MKRRLDDDDRAVQGDGKVGDAGVAVVQVVVTAGPRDELQDWQSLGVH